MAADDIRVGNFFRTTLVGSITSGATPDFVVTVTDGSGLPTLAAGQHFYVTLINGDDEYEIMKVTVHAAASNSLTVGARAQDGTTELEFDNGDLVELWFAAQTFRDLRDEVNLIGAGTVTGVDELSLTLDGGGVASIKDLGVTTAKIANGAVGNTQLANNAVSEGRIQSGAVTTDKIAGDAVTDTQIANGAVKSDQIEGGAVVFSKIQQMTPMTVVGNKNVSLAYPDEITIYDNDNMTPGEDNALATQQSIKAYVDNTKTTVDASVAALVAKLANKVAASNAEYSTSATSGWKTASSQGITTLGASSKVLVQVTPITALWYDSGDPDETGAASYRIRRNGTTIASGTCPLLPVTPGTGTTYYGVSPVGVSVLDTPGAAGLYTYTVEIERNGGSGNLYLRAHAVTLQEVPQ